ncbi:MAG: 4,5-DOPA dioxygenase extradiol [Megasphaera sp.]|jgi:4,5-DOPA dioxygenase extradiol|uniref:4,5-DOPA-extradiol-dioxygenase n=1 Tax=Megasphaera sueciensis TaxID=349094 RepID=UPI003D02294A|nr:4,5-DOPA dioxygenase extradiol [Megasphaera sp.]MCI1822334.1 4,5-DOPA dioxygenase extradiol [Megasphaera sp.]
MKKMPVLFIGHGNPMNAIEENDYVKTWRSIPSFFEKPTAILAISAHWYTDGSYINNLLKPQQIYDMYGFPKALYELQYHASGSPALASQVQQVLGDDIAVDNSWGIDHGSWSVLQAMYPEADIPVVQMSVNKNISLQRQFLLGRALRPLRDRNILILASGNIVHNLAMLDWELQAGFHWADKFDHTVRDYVIQHDYDAVFRLMQEKSLFQFSVPTLDHFSPLVYAMGASSDEDVITVYNDSRTMGALSMTSFVFA